MQANKHHLGIAPRVSAVDAAQMVSKTTSSEWAEVREQNAIALFVEAVERVPAYRKFLSAHGFDTRTVTSWEDFQQIPAMSKKEYLRQYPLEELCWDGSLARPATFSATSGSTGKPFYFPRSLNLEEEYSAIVEVFLSQGTLVPSSENPTLVIIGFGMGVWIGGMLTYRAYEIASHRGYPVSILPAGINKDEILNALRELSPQFKQTVLIGYPPFIKDILDEAEREGIELSALNLRLQFAAESFTEHFRDYLGKKAGIKNVLRDTLNIYGTADIGAMAFETPTAILIRRLAIQHAGIFSALFGNIQKLPTLAQYNPAFMTFETNDEGEILLTGNSAVPLIRYAVGDHGGVMSFAKIKDLLKQEGISLEDEAKKNDIPLYELPFVYVYARVDLSTKLYGAIIYPEHIREALEDEDLQKFVTGKCTIQTLSDDSHAQYLEVNVELRPDPIKNEQLEILIREKIIEKLLAKNSEYHNNYNAMGERVHPRIVLWSNGDTTHFKSGVKQQWVKK